MATPGSAVAHQLKGLPAFFSPYTRSWPKNGGTEMRTEEGLEGGLGARKLGRGKRGRKENKRRDHRRLPRSTSK